jgi:hypothetical protein
VEPRVPLLPIRPAIPLAWPICVHEGAALYREKTDAEIVAILAAEGHRSGTGRPITVRIVANLRRSRGWRKYRRRP